MKKNLILFFLNNEITNRGIPIINETIRLKMKENRKNLLITPSKLDTENVQQLEAILRNKPNSQKLDGLLTDKIPSDMLAAFLSLCPPQNGPVFQKLVSKVLTKIFRPIIDESLIQQECHITGSRIDIVLPFCVESLSENSFWDPWYHRYSIKSIIVEVKNEHSQAKPEDIRQIYDYIHRAKQGNFGIIVARNGFTKDSRKILKEYSAENILILPLDQNDLKLLLELSQKTPFSVFQYLSRIERLLNRFQI